MQETAEDAVNFAKTTSVAKMAHVAPNATLV
jgi:hypothetical protein